MKDKITQLGHDHDEIRRKLEQIERLLLENDAIRRRLAKLEDWKDEHEDKA